MVPLSISSSDKSLESRRISNDNLECKWPAPISQSFHDDSYCPGQLLQIFVEILKKSASSLVDTVVVYYLEPATFGRQLKSSLFRGGSKVNQGGLGILQGGQGLLSGCEHGGVSGHPSKAIHGARQYGGRFKIQSKWFRIDNYVGRF